MMYQKRDTSSGSQHPLVDAVTACFGQHLGAFIVACIYGLCFWTLCVHWSTVAPELIAAMPIFGLFLVGVHQFLHWGVAVSLYKSMRTDPGYVQLDMALKHKSSSNLELNLCEICFCVKPGNDGCCVVVSCSCHKDGVWHL